MNNQNQNANKPLLKKVSFEYFEITYAGGLFGWLSLRVDSNKIYFSSNGHRSVKYGILPDSIFKSIDTTILLLQKDTMIKSINEACFDCDALAINVKVGHDTIQIVQYGQISDPLMKVAKQLNSFTDSSNHNYINAYLYLKTAEEELPLPPKVEN